MNAFDESLERVLDPDHYLWSMIGSDAEDAGQEREVEIRLDVPAANAEMALDRMNATGWEFASRPDEGNDPLERIYWRRVTSVRRNEVSPMLSDALKVAHDCEGTLMSWIDIEDLNE